MAAEDVALCKAYIAVSEDVETDSQQKGKLFWKKIEEKFKEFSPIGSQVRNSHGLNNRWLIISASIQKYVSYLSFYHRNARSGEQTEIDIARNAYSEYTLIQRKPFPFDECYEVVKCIPKFNYLLVSSNGAQAGGEDETIDSNLNSSPFEFPGFNISQSAQVGDSSSQPQSLDEVQRPPGQRKKKARRTGSASSSSVESVLEESSNKIVLAMKEREVSREKEREDLARCLRLKEEELQWKKQEMMMKMREDDRIMAIATDNMPVEARNYWISRKQEVVARRAQRSGNYP